MSNGTQKRKSAPIVGEPLMPGGAPFAADEQLQARVTCRACEGTGTSRASSHYQCRRCDAGIPFLDYVAGDGLPCGHEYDRGYLVRVNCEACGGKGHLVTLIPVAEFVARIMRDMGAEAAIQRDRREHGRAAPPREGGEAEA